MSGLALRITPELPIPPATITRATCQLRTGLVVWARQATYPRAFRAVGTERWIATADHKSRLARFECTTLNLLFTSDLGLPEAPTHALCQIVPEGMPEAWSAVRYSRHTRGLVRVDWELAAVTGWYTEGIGVHYGVDDASRIQALLLSGMQIRLR